MSQCFQEKIQQPKKKFKKAVQHKWKERAIILQKAAPRIRSEAYRMKMADCMRERQLSTHQARSTIMEIAGTFSVKVAAAMLKMSREQQKVLRQAMDQAVLEAHRAALDPQQYRDKVLSLKIFNEEQAAEYVSQIVEGVDDFFICRKIPCRHIGPNRSWIKRANHARWRCPRCTMEYWPWESKPNLVPAQKAFVFSDMNPNIPGEPIMRACGKGAAM